MVALGNAKYYVQRTKERKEFAELGKNDKARAEGVKCRLADEERTEDEMEQTEIGQPYVQELGTKKIIGDHNGPSKGIVLARAQTISALSLMTAWLRPVTSYPFPPCQGLAVNLPGYWKMPSIVRLSLVESSHVCGYDVKRTMGGRQVRSPRHRR